MEQDIVNCALSTEYFKRGKTAVKQRVLRFLKTGSNLGSYCNVQWEITEDAEMFFDNLGDLDEIPDGRYELLVTWIEGGYECPDDGEYVYSLREKVE